MNKRQWLLAAAGSVVMLLSGCASTGSSATIADLTARDPSLSTLNQLVRQAGMEDSLRGAGPYTLFAPNNEAFKAMSAKTLSDLSADPARLKALLQHHLLPGKTMAADIGNGQVSTLLGSKLSLSRAGTFVTVDESIVTQADLPASNGVIHVIDRVLTPPAAAKK